MRKFVPIFVLLALLAICGMTPAAASASVADSFRGNAVVAPANGATWAGAWKWYDNYGWYATYRSAKASVWVQPYAIGWDWTWTATSGWLAMRTSDLSAPVASTGSGLEGTVYIVHCPIPGQTTGTGCTRRTSAGTRITIGTGSPLGFHSVTSATTDANGHFSIPLAPGPYQVNVGTTASGANVGPIGMTTLDVDTYDNPPPALPSW